MSRGRPERKKRARLVVIVPVAVMLAGTLADLPAWSGADHAGLLAVPGFWSVFGLLGCFVLVGAAKLAASLFLKRPEDYYDDAL